MKRRVLAFVLLGSMVCSLAGCHSYEPTVSEKNAASGQAVQAEKTDREPAIKEVEEAYHRAIQHEVYMGYMEKQDWFSSKELKLYRKKKKNGYCYILVHKNKEKQYDLYYLNYYNDCEEPGFETSVVIDSNCTKEDRKEALQGMEQLGTMDAWKWQGEQKPDYLPMSSATKKLVQSIEKKVIEEANQYCIVSKKKTCHAYIQQFNCTDRNVLVSLVIEEASGEDTFSLCEFFCELHPELEFDFDVLDGTNPDDKWSFTPLCDRSDIKEITDTAMTDFSFTIEPEEKLETMGLSEDEQQQIRLLSKKRKKYIAGDVQRLKWMISDLNQNGRLELVLLESTSHDECAAIYEVSEDRKKLVSCKKVLSKAGNGQKTELFKGEREKTAVYHDSSAGVYYYPACVRWQSDQEEAVIEQEGDFCLDGTQFKERIFAERCIFDADDLEKADKYKVNGKKAAKNVYRAAVEKHWDGMEKKTAVFGWRERGTLLTTMEYDEEECAIRFAKSWQEFSVK